MLIRYRKRGYTDVFYRSMHSRLNVHSAETTYKKNIIGPAIMRTGRLYH